MTRMLRLATRASPLALWQARHAAHLLRRAHPGLRVALVPITSSGDTDTSTPLYKLGNIGIFCKEVHAAVLDGRADAGVHSLKDLPTTPPQGLGIAAVMRRADPRDALIGARSIADLPPQALVGTSSLRRQAQLRLLRPDLRFTSIRGNVDTRIGKTRDGTVDATLLAMAGLGRLGRLRRAGAVGLHPTAEMIPAPGQGAVAIDCRLDDQRSEALLMALDDHDSRRATRAERAVLAALEGGCSLPLGCHAQRHGQGWHLHAVLADPDGGPARRYRGSGPLRRLADEACTVLLQA